jgi:glycosyltransferase involved in cell wall biosynthesis
VESRRPSTTVIIPVYNGATRVRECLLALAKSVVQPSEIIVVDDGSTDASAQVSAALGAKVISSPSQQGPAAARNLGAKKAAGDILIFLDSDVRVHPEAIGLIVEDLDRDPELAAVFGSYDDSPGAENFVSWYKNYQHHFVHQKNPTQACTFWSGCGAVRRELFLSFGGFDTAYYRPSIEDIEFGSRLHRAGHAIKLNRNIQVQHLKRLGITDLVRTDMCDRAIPWTRLLLKNGGKLPETLNLAFRHRISVLFSIILFLSFALGSIQLRAPFAAPFISLTVLFLSAYWASVARDRTKDAALALLVWIVIATWTIRWHNHGLLIWLPVSAHIVLAARSAFWIRTNQWWRLSGMVAGFYILVAAVLVLSYAPRHWFSLIIVSAATGVLLLNIDFYVFLAKRWGKLYALSSVPFHVLYQLYSGLGFILGTAWYVGDHMRSGNSMRREAKRLTLLQSGVGQTAMSNMNSQRTP